MANAILNVTPILRSFMLEASKPIEWSRTYTEGGAFTESIATGTSDQSMNFVGVTTAKLLVFAPVDGTLTIKLNSSTGSAFAIDSGGVLVVAGGAITSAYVSNTSGAAVKAVFMVVD